MKILLVTDAWHPQINGVVCTLSTIRRELEALGHHVYPVTPEDFETFPCPTYPEIRLAMGAAKKLERIADSFQPHAIHIATEGPLGLAARKYCRDRGFHFTTSFHTRFPEYIEARFRVPSSVTYGLMRWFHGPSSAVMVATPTVRKELMRRGFQNTVQWSRGVDTELFRPRDKDFLPGPRPISMYVGRVAVEKNIRAFLDLKLAGTKYVVGEGPQLAALKEQYPEVRFVGAKRGEELARHYASADVFVFPSRTDTFGLVLLEALASGVPVAAYPVPGPLDVIGNSGAGALDEDLGAAVEKALTISADAARKHALRFSWSRCAQEFYSYLRPFRPH